MPSAMVYDTLQPVLCQAGTIPSIFASHVVFHWHSSGCPVDGHICCYPLFDSLQSLYQGFIRTSVDACGEFNSVPMLCPKDKIQSRVLSHLKQLKLNRSAEVNLCTSQGPIRSELILVSAARSN